MATKKKNTKIDLKDKRTKARKANLPVYEAKPVGGDIKIALTDKPEHGEFKTVEDEYEIIEVDIDGKVGVGDLLEKTLKSKPLKTIVEKVKEIIWKDDEDCRCDGRRKRLNSVKLPVRHKAHRCLTKPMYDQYGEYRKVRTLKYLSEHVKILIDLYAHVFAIQYNQADLCTNCNGAYKVIKSIEQKLDIVYESYEE